MRIISGKYKGRRLTAPKKLPVRPTTDMAKEALFNIFNNRFYFDELNVLDLFSGTGNISYEFASRGTKRLTAVDGHQGCVRYIAKTAQELDFSIATIKSDVYKFLQATPDKFDLIFADPPYNFEVEQFFKIADLVFEKELLLKDGLLIIEHSEQTNLSGHPKFTEQRKYGGSIFSFFEAE
ncbi:MAG: methyltransferase [Algicola sp.]|nr:methyltransferase [Algicola sp.]